jgi:carbohydrate-selective porin OprB
MKTVMALGALIAALLVGPAFAAPPPAAIANASGVAVPVDPTTPVGLSYKNITSATTTTVITGAGWLHGISINTLVASATITIYDNTAASGTKIGTITLPSTITGAAPFSVLYDVAFTNGLTVVTSGATDITVSAR